MLIPDVDWGQVVNGGAGLISLYLATQIRRVVQNHEVRINALENNPSKRKRTNKSKRKYRRPGY